MYSCDHSNLVQDDQIWGFPWGIPTGLLQTELVGWTERCLIIGRGDSRVFPYQMLGYDREGADTTRMHPYNVPEIKHRNQPNLGMLVKECSHLDCNYFTYMCACSYEHGKACKVMYDIQYGVMWGELYLFSNFSFSSIPLNPILSLSTLTTYSLSQQQSWVPYIQLLSRKESKLAAKVSHHQLNLNKLIITQY